MIRKTLLTLLRSLCCLLLLMPLSLRAEEMRFDVVIAGVRAAQVGVNARDMGSTYALAARFQATGLVGALTDAAYSAQAEGRMARGAPRPARAVLEDQSGDVRGRRVVRWSGGVGRLAEATPPVPPEPWSVDRSPSGAVDPLTAFWSLLRTRPADGLCNAQVTTFDGVRVGRLSLGAPQADGDGFTCAGQFERLAGYAPEELAEQRLFPFRARFGPGGAGFQVVEVRAPTQLGPARLRRR
ncbi:MAG: hypothetical protein AAFY65_10260 [Pseudomonadota bacterium]